MDTSSTPANQPAPQHHSNLIRAEQVGKLPHLDQKQKLDYTAVVRNLWDMLNGRDPQSPEYQNALVRLNHISQTLMKGMRVFQQTRQQTQAAGQNQQGQSGQRPQALNPQNFTQLLPQIQQKINSIQLLPPLNLAPEQVPQWQAEARLRYGIALQKHEVGRARLAELRQQFSQRQSAGNMSREEVQEFKNRQLVAEKILREGNEFLTRFKDQQENVKAQRAQQLGQTAVQDTSGQAQPQTAHPDQAPVATTAPSGENRPASVSAQVLPGQVTAPAPHTINSAVTAARNQAGQVSASPVTSQPSQTPTAQVPAAISAPPPPPSQQQQQQHPQPSQPQTQQQRPQGMQGIQGVQGGFAQTTNPTVSASTTTAPTAGAPLPPIQPPHQQEQPRPLSHQAAMQQAAQNYANNVNQQNMPQAAVNPHAHPHGYIPNRNTENSTRNTNMPIPKNLNVSAPEPIPMAPARPTLSGGPSHGAMGMMGQPAIQKHPGYVLEGEGQRVLSKKMLDTLVRQVTRGGEGEGLTPDAEEFILQMADDFVDDVVTAACRLAKLRPSSTLELRDIQLVLERNYNMRISGFGTDDLRTVKKPQPTQGWTQKMSAIQAAKVTQGRAE
ncbi:Transcription initiation factor TFIID subunit 12 [Monascus purpureus]|uniref:Transcription initiation factor TFIID subunit 12 n=1 Tax=Monascus purpureus TaxID=5098 RepID=A0A507QTH9_MONPU|nr:Transcription initiation factor TFIID subunit 12 [Monascus purpureus]BDD63304.1 hypothetical protein MAP00_008214 [Monascus purpureus]